MADSGQGPQKADASHQGQGVWGEDDALVSSVYAEEFAARIANSQVEIIKDCGHVPQIERLEIVKPLVANFLAA
ncbi:MAG: alpha/beta fold hydrolase [Xanthobacteraceae bacterium]